MNKKYLFIIIAVIILAPVAYWLLSPLFYSVEVNESIDDLYGMAGIEKTGTVTPLPISEMQPPAGLDPVKESKGPTTPPPVAVETMQTIGAGTFDGLAGHSGEGRAELLLVNGKYFLRFEDDFQVTNGPDLYVGLGRSGEYAKEAEIARLKGNVGSQNYEIPSSIDINKYNEVWVWCRTFSVPFAKAELR